MSKQMRFALLSGVVALGMQVSTPRTAVADVWYGVFAEGEVCQLAGTGCTDDGKLVRFEGDYFSTRDYTKRTIVGDTRIRGLSGLAFDPLNRRLVAGTFNGKLYVLDEHTATHTGLVLGLDPDPSPPPDVDWLFTPQVLTALEYHPITGELYGVVEDRSFVSALVKLDLDAVDAYRRLEIDIIGVIGQGDLPSSFYGVEAIAFDAQGQLHGTAVKAPIDPQGSDGPSGPYLIRLNTTHVAFPDFAVEIGDLVVTDTFAPRAMAAYDSGFVLSISDLSGSPARHTLRVVTAEAERVSVILTHSDFDGQVHGLAPYFEFDMLPPRPPEIHSFAPSGGNQGIIARIQGSGFTANGRSNVAMVSFGGTPAYGPPVVVGDDELAIVVPSAFTGPISVVNNTDVDPEPGHDYAVSTEDFARCYLKIFESDSWHDAEFNQGMPARKTLWGDTEFPLIAGKDTLIRLLTASDDRGVLGTGTCPVTFGTANLHITKPNGEEMNVLPINSTNVFSNEFVPGAMEITQRHNINFYVSGDDLDEVGTYNFRFEVTAKPDRPGPPLTPIYTSNASKDFELGASDAILVVFGGIFEPSTNELISPDDQTMASILRAFDEMSRVWPTRNGVGGLADWSAGVRFDFAPWGIVIGSQFGRYDIDEDWGPAKRTSKKLLDAYNELNSPDAHRVALFVDKAAMSSDADDLGMADRPGDFSVSFIGGHSEVPIHEFAHNWGVVLKDSVGNDDDDDGHSKNKWVYQGRDPRVARFFNVPARSYTLDYDPLPHSIMGAGVVGDGKTFFTRWDYDDLLWEATRTSSSSGWLAAVSSASAVAPSIMTVIAEISRDDTAEVLHAYISQSDKPLSQVDPDSPYALVFLDQAGNVLAQEPFFVSFTAHGFQNDIPVERPETVVTLVRPLPEGTRRIQIQKDQQLLTELARSDSGPTFTSLSAPFLGQIIGSNETVQLAWEATDPDGDSLTYSVSYSPNPLDPPDEVRWLPISSGIVDTELVWNTRFTPGAANGLIRFTVTDGFNTHTVHSEPFIVDPNPPMISIVHPADGQVFHEHDSIVLRAIAFDLEAGMLGGDALQWSDELDDALGAGRRIVLEPNTLAPGDHVIQLTVLDDGAVVQAQVSISILADTDRDGLSDDFEAMYDSQNPDDPYDSGQDVDGDGLSSLSEATFGTDPEDPDSDDDGEVDGQEISEGRDPTNRPPTCHANGPYVSECLGTTTVQLDASGSSDDDGDPLTYSWSGTFEIASSQVPGPSLEVQFIGTGVFDLVLEVSDGKESTQCSTTVTIADTRPPLISLDVTPDILWPPNHKMVPITTQVAASDACDPNPTYFLSSVTANEGDVTNTFDPSFDEILGNGHTANDIQLAEDGTIYLRAERSGKNDGRVYTITYTASDQSGNSASVSNTVTVPHSP